MVTKAQLLEKTDAYLKAYPPDRGYTRKVVDALTKAKLKIGDNIGVQLALQYDGKETPQDEVTFAEGSEVRTPYKASFSLDVGGDCADFCRNIILLLMAKKSGGKWTFKNIGNYTEGIWQNYHTKMVPWSERRPMDIILYKFSDRNPHATHAALYIGGGFILHTTSTSNPLRVQADSYGASGRVGVFRVLTDDEYNSLIVDSTWNESSGEVDNNNEEGETDMLVLNDPRHNLVARYQRKLVMLGEDIGNYQSILDPTVKDGTDGRFGEKTKLATKNIQARLNVDTSNLGCGDVPTVMAMDEELAIREAAKYKAQGEELAAVKRGADAMEASLGIIKSEASKYSV